MFSLEGHTASIQRCMFFNHNQQMLLTASLDGTLKVWCCSKIEFIQMKIAGTVWSQSGLGDRISPSTCSPDCLGLLFKSICYLEQKFEPSLYDFNQISVHRKCRKYNVSIVVVCRCGMYRQDAFSCLALTAAASMSCLATSLKTTRDCCQHQWIDMPRYSKLTTK